MSLANQRDDRRLLLWDIDGTLVRTGSIGGDVFDLALETLFGRRPSTRVNMGGKTDPQIVREYLAMLDLQVEGDEHVLSVLGELEAEMANAKEAVAREGFALPGVHELLVHLEQDPRVTQSVLTGNIAPNALVKLSAFGLERYLDLDIGAYGSDSEDRRRLVPVALERAKERRGLEFSPEQVWVIGDTAHDLACAMAGGAHCVLVATGRVPIEELTGLGADAVFSDLSRVDDILAVLAPLDELFDSPRTSSG